MTNYRPIRRRPRSRIRAELRPMPRIHYYS